MSIIRNEIEMAFIRGEHLDPTAILSKFKLENVVQKLKRTKAGVPKQIKLTEAPIEEKNLAQMPRKDKKRLFRLMGKLQKNPRKALPKLLALHEKYPKVPSITNYIAVAYNYEGQKEQCLRWLQFTYDRFPEYLFGKISLAEFFLNQKQHRRIPELLGRKFELWQHDPDAEVFHISEFRSFFGVVGTYFARRGEINRALFHYLVLRNVLPDSWDTENLAKEIVASELERMKKRYT